VIEGKQVRINPADEVVAEMRQLYDRGIRNFWFTDAQFIPPANSSAMRWSCCKRLWTRA
jgi:radical SAM superfamily enzyme YgiQ (UPF0313 family)